MLVISRKVGTSIIVESPDGTSVVTVLRIFPDRCAMSILVNRETAAHSGQSESRSTEVQLADTIKINETAKVTLRQVVGDKVHLGINVHLGNNSPHDILVQRLETYEAKGDSGGGMAGSPIPRPSSPRPSALDIHLDEPRSADEGDE